MTPRRVVTEQELPLLLASLQDCPVIDKNGYPYFVHPLTDGIPRVEPALLREVAAAVAKAAQSVHFDLIVTAEAMGIPLAAAVAYETDTPYTVVRKRSYGLPGEISTAQTTGYSQGALYLNGIPQDARVLIVDDVLSTGGTVRALVNALRQAGAKPVKVIEVFSKIPHVGDYSRKIGVPVEALLVVEVRQGRVAPIRTNVPFGPDPDAEIDAQDVTDRARRD